MCYVVIAHIGSVACWSVMSKSYIVTSYVARSHICGLAQTQRRITSSAGRRRAWQTICTPTGTLTRRPRLDTRSESTTPYGTGAYIKVTSHRRLSAVHAGPRTYTECSAISSDNSLGALALHRAHHQTTIRTFGHQNALNAETVTFVQTLTAVARRTAHIDRLQDSAI